MINLIITMIFKYNTRKINTNLAGDSFHKLNSGRWKLGFFSENAGLNNKDNNAFYQDYTIDNETHRGLKNKVSVRLINGEIVNKHIILWNRSQDYFCITEDKFWDRFDTK